MRLRVVAVAALAVTVLGGLAPSSAEGPPAVVVDPYTPTPSGPCGPGARPETTQGRVAFRRL